MKQATPTSDDLHIELRSMQRALIWTGNALILGGLLGFGLGIRWGMRHERARQREQSRL